MKKNIKLINSETKAVISERVVSNPLEYIKVLSTMHMMSSMLHLDVEIEITEIEVLMIKVYGFTASILREGGYIEDLECVGFISEEERKEMMDWLIEKHDDSVVFVTVDGEIEA